MQILRGKEGGGGVTRLNKKQAQALGILQIQKSKYHSRMVEVDGHIFDSKKEVFSLPIRN